MCSRLLALTRGDEGRRTKTLKNLCKFAWLLRHCYPEVLPPINQRGAVPLPCSDGTATVLVYAIKRCTSADSLEYVKSAS
jgi:hypothetical protein